MSYAKNATLLSTLWALLSFGAYSQGTNSLTFSGPIDTATMYPQPSDGVAPHRPRVKMVSDSYRTAIIGRIVFDSEDTTTMHPQPAEGVMKFRTRLAIVPDSQHTGNMKIRRAVFDSEDTTAMHPQPSDGVALFRRRSELLFDSGYTCIWPFRNTPPYDIKGWPTGASVDTVPEPSTRIPDAHLRAAVKLIEHLRLDSLMLARDVKLWETKFGSASNTINLLNQRIETYKLLVANYEKSGGNTDKQLANDAALVKSMRAAIKREKTKTVLGVSLTAILAGLTIYLTHK